MTEKLGGRIEMNDSLEPPDQCYIFASLGCNIAPSGRDFNAVPVAVVAHKAALKQIPGGEIYAFMGSNKNGAGMSVPFYPDEAAEERRA